MKVFSAAVFPAAAVLLITALFPALLFCAEPADSPPPSPAFTVIQTEASSDDYDSKQIALDSIKELYIDRGQTDGEALSILEMLALEGTLNIAHLNNYISNNFPEIRQQALVMLGMFSYSSDYADAASGARQVLERVCYVENEPVNVVQAFLSLANIEKSDTDGARRSRALDVINLTFYKRNAKSLGDRGGAGTSANNPIGMAYLEAVETFITEGEFPSANTLSTTITQVKLVSDNFNYRTPIRDKAKSIISILQGKLIKVNSNASAGGNGSAAASPPAASTAPPP